MSNDRSIVRDCAGKWSSDGIGTVAKHVCAGEIALRSTNDCAQVGKKKWQNVRIETNFEVAIWSPEIMFCRERKMCGFVHKDDFVKDSRQLAWTESHLNEKRSLGATTTMTRRLQSQVIRVRKLRSERI